MSALYAARVRRAQRRRPSARQHTATQRILAAMHRSTSSILTLLGGVALAACGGSDAATIDAAGADVDAASTSVDAAPELPTYIDLGDGPVALPYHEAYLYSFDGTTSLIFGASTSATYDCFQVPGCVAVFITLPEDAPVGDLTCVTAGTQVTVQTDTDFFSSSPLAGFAGGGGGCDLTLDARGPIGAAHALSGLTATLLTGGLDLPSLEVLDGAITTVRGPDQAPPI